MRISRRTSEQKCVINQQDHDSLLPRYLLIIEELQSKFEVNERPEYAELVNFEKNKELDIHNWFYYKQGYSEELIRKILSKSNLSKDRYVLDPFCGVGTTQAVAQKFKIKSVGLEINPIAQFASEVKTYEYTAVDVEELKKILANLTNRLQVTKHIPKYQKLSNIFRHNQLEQILQIKGFYENVEQTHLRNFFKLAYISIIETCSNRIKDGNGIKISNNKSLIEDVVEFYIKKCTRMIQDLKRKNYHAESKSIFGSILQDAIYKKLENLDIGLVVFSPPYANCFDYCEVSKMEIWLGDFVYDYRDFDKYREIAVRSHVNAKFNHNISNYDEKVDLIASLIGTYNVWNKNIPDMLRGYFDDMYKVISRIFNLLKVGDQCEIIVANSSYKGIIVPTDLLLANIAESIGFTVEQIIAARTMRSSSQQVPELKSKKQLMRESVIILSK